LTPRGREQMRASLAAIAAPRFSAIASSPLVRCRDFAAEIAAEHAVALDVLPALAEMRFGAWEGLTSVEAAARDPDRFAAFRADPMHAGPPNGEPYFDFSQRVREGFDAWTRNRSGHALLVTHAGVMRALLGDWLAIPAGNLFRIALPPAATCRVSLLANEPPCVLGINIAAKA
jgi:alpha-ribazole phosphatase